MINVSSSPDPADEAQFVSDLTGHLSMPCGTDAGNLRQHYINEAERILQQNAVTDPHQRNVLQDAITMAQWFVKLEKGNP